MTKIVQFKKKQRQKALKAIKIQFYNREIMQLHLGGLEFSKI